MGQAFQLLLLAALAVGVVVVAWIRSRGDQDETAQRGRLRQFGWPLALVLLTVSVLAGLSGTFHPYGIRSWMVVVALAVAVVLALRPGLAEWAVPVGLLVLGLLGLLVARSSLAPDVPPPALMAAPGVAGSSVTVAPPIVTGTLESSLLLPLAYGSLLLGGWLTWRSPHPMLASWRRSASRLASLPRRAQLRALLLIPVALMAVELPGGVPSVGVAALLLGLSLVAAVVVLQRWPGAGQRLAVAGLVLLGLVGLVMATQFQYGSTDHDYGLVDLMSRSSPALVVAEALVLLAFGAWLAPQTFPTARRLLGLPPDPELTRQVQQLAESRAVVADTAASDFRRLERDLHDGAQARLVALGMSLRAAERMIPVNQDAALALVAEARETSAQALTELRELVRGVHPPVLADRGLADAVRALALDSPLTVQTQIELPGRVAAPVETACYFAVAELLTNAAKHSGARDARIDVRHDDGRLRIEVTDFGLGGADPAAGSGLARRGEAAGRVRRHHGDQQPGWRADHRGAGGAVRAVVAEDLYLLRDGLVRLLEAHGLEIAAAVGDAPGLLTALLAERPDVAIVDVRLPPTFTDDGLRAAIQARRAVPGLPVLVLSQYVEQLYARELLADKGGGVGYLLKDRVFNDDQFIDAIQAVAAGGTVMDPEVVTKLLGRQARQETLARLSGREREVLELMAEGRSNSAIAQRLFVSEKAVSERSTSIFAKLDLAPSDDDNRRVLAVLTYLNG